ncbi:hypothetical protein [Salinicoccus halitifaciens]|uniref:Uncharacterized protein n=1 Tax=Salinicoccus halitifaciens TaxID=1073415 RepID=A0ABV2EB32_9STAP|nr:hypothetical protein [Salinicoccus halitifaciens]MCD2137516.1 hypothetical protein [Salinicoccus halitifaciens]
MRLFFLFMCFTIELTGCTAVGDSEVEAVDVDALDSDMQEYVQNEDIINIMHIRAEDGEGDYLAFYAPGATRLTVEEAEEGILDIRMEKPDDAEAEILHVYKLEIGTEVETLRYYINGTETHVEVLPK